MSTFCCTLAFATLAMASETEADSNEAQANVAAQLKLLKSAEPELADKAAEQLIQLANTADKERFAYKQAKWMAEVFKESSNLQHRKAAFELLYNHARGELQGLTKRFDITTPMYGCIGRFHGSVQHVLHSEFDEVWMVALSQGKVPKKETSSPSYSLWESEGPTAVLRLHIYASHEINEEDIFRVLSESRYFDMKSWTVSVQKPVLEFISKK